MNTLERRRMIKERMVDVAVAKTEMNASRRRRREAARRLQKSMVASRFAARPVDTISYPQRDA